MKWAEIIAELGKLAIHVVEMVAAVQQRRHAVVRRCAMQAAKSAERIELGCIRKPSA